MAGVNDLATTDPDLAAEWDAPLNHDLTPDMVTPGSQKTVAWKCGCGCVWYARIDARARKNGTGCPACAGQLNRVKIAYYGRVEAEAPRRRRIAQGDNRAEAVTFLSRARNGSGSASVGFSDVPGNA